jgi:hypothetical protein
MHIELTAVPHRLVATFGTAPDDRLFCEHATLTGCPTPIYGRA